MRRFGIHPLFFAAFPVLFLFSQNAALVEVDKVYMPLAVVLIGAILLAVAAALLMRDARRGALLASGWILLFLSYGHLAGAIEGKRVGSFVVGRDLVLLILWAVLAFGWFVFVRRVSSLDEVTAIANGVGLLLFALAVYNSAGAISSRGVDIGARAGERASQAPRPTDEGQGVSDDRDIFYLVFDRYGSDEVLGEYMGIDNSSFTGALRERGFAVADDAVANYPTTAHSLSSSMNMNHLDSVVDRVGADSSDKRPLFQTITGPKVSKFLQARGYSYAHIGNWYNPTAHDATAQINYHYDRRSEFTRVLIRTTLIQPFSTRFGFLSELDGRRVSHNQIKFQLDAIRRAAELDGPTFVFAHLLLPHLPYTFAADGSFVAEAEEKTKGWKENYAEQLRFTNAEILALVDDLLAGPEESRPVVVLQADEGPKDEGWQWGLAKRWEDAPDEVLDMKFGILNAIYAPGAGITDPPTPVNTFRMIFDAYFDANLGRLPDASYVYGTRDEPYRLTEVTDRL